MTSRVSLVKTGWRTVVLSFSPEAHNLWSNSFRLSCCMLSITWFRVLVSDFIQFIRPSSHPTSDVQDIGWLWQGEKSFPDLRDGRHRRMFRVVIQPMLTLLPPLGSCWHVKPTDEGQQRWEHKLPSDGGSYGKDQGRTTTTWSWCKKKKKTHIPWPGNDACDLLNVVHNNLWW